MSRREVLIGLAGVLVLWQTASMLLRSPVVPAPVPVLLLFWDLLPGVLGMHAAASLGRTVAAVTLAVAPALPLGIFLGRNAAADRVLTPITYVLYPLPKTALLPLFMLLLGVGNLAKVGLVATVLFFQALLTVRDAARTIPGDYVTTLRILGANRLQILRHVLFPAVLPGLFSALRLAVGTSLAVLFFAETFFTVYGLGWFIMDAWTRIDYTRMFAGLVCLGLSGLLLFVGIDAAERLLCPWTRQTSVPAGQVPQGPAPNP